KITQKTGVVLTGIVEGSAAAKIGLKKGDLITNFDGKPIENYQDLVSAIQARKPNDAVSITFISEGAEQTKNVILGETKAFNWNSNSFAPNFDFDPNRPFLGVTGVFTDDEVETNQGAAIQKVMENSTAFEMGIKPNDVIVAFNNAPIKNFTELSTEIKKHKVDDEIIVKVLRNDQTLELKGKLKPKANPEMYFAEQNVKTFNSNNNQIKVIIEIDSPSQTEVEAIESNSGIKINPENNLTFDDFMLSPNPGNGVYEVAFTPNAKGDLNLYVFTQEGKKV